MSQYRVLVTGSRDCNTEKAREAIQRQFDALRDYGVATNVDVVIIHGGARGVDSIAHAEAKKRHFTTITVYPQWDDYENKRSAALDRNIAMITEWSPAVCLAFNAGSNGTGHQIDACTRYDVPVREISIPR